MPGFQAQNGRIGGLRNAESTFSRRLLFTPITPATPIMWLAYDVDMLLLQSGTDMFSPRPELLHGKHTHDLETLSQRLGCDSLVAFVFLLLV